MNILPVIIKNTQSAEGVMMALVETEGTLLQVMMIDSAGSKSWFLPGDHAEAIFKETEVFLGKGNQGGLSIHNQLLCEVMHFDKGTLVSIVILRFGHSKLYAAIETAFLDKLNLETGDHITAMIMSNNITLMKHS
jgi:molybdopterin-binding protein